MSPESEKITTEIAKTLENWKPALHVEVKGMKNPVDLTDHVTVFVSTVGDRENLNDCLAALDKQDSRFRFELINHVAPMSAAFQAMADRCKTPYYVQVDEDMILHPYAIRILHDAITKADGRVAIACYSLWDRHLTQAILGVKIYRHAVIKNYRYRPDVPHCDVEQLERLQRDGYKIDVCFLGPQYGVHCIGDHGAHYTPETAYEAYYNRAAKSRMFPQWMSWIRSYLPKFWARAKAANATPVDLYAFAGFAAGLSADLSQFDHEKDWRTPNHDFRRFQADMETALPTQLSLHVSTQCNMRCQWCPRQAGLVPPKPDMTVETLTTALKICPTIKSVCVAGFGEPLLCSNLGAIIMEAKRQNLFVGLITNGVLLKDFAPVLNSWRLDTVSVSLNAASAESHKRCNGTETWDRVLDGIREAVKIFPERVAVSMVIHRDNVDEMGPFLDLAADLGVTHVDFLSLLPGAGDNRDFWQRTIDESHALQIAAVRMRPAAKLVRTWPTVVSKTDCPRRCQSPYESLSVDSEGFVSPCRRVMAPSAKFGKLDAGTPPWRLPGWYSLRAAIEGDVELPEVCKMCFGNWSA